MARNGHRERRLDTCVGTLTLRVPKLREGTSFPDDVLSRWSRTDTALASCVCDEYFYQRSWNNDAFEIYILQDSEIVYHATGNNMDEMSEEVLALRIYDGKTAKEAEQGICVQFEA